MSEKNMSIVFSASIDRLTEYNSSFDKGILRVCYVGANRNNSFISEETFELCMPSIYNCPIVCNYDRETGEIGSHDMEIVKGEDGRLSLVNITDPVGVVPESAKYWFENFEEEDGTVHKYLYVEVLLWKRQEAYQKIKEDGITDESMEISIKEGHMENGIYVIERFEFTAFCLLGTAKPCYESASLMVFSQEDFKMKLGEMMREFKENVQTAQSPDGVGIYLQFYSEGGKKALDKKKELMSKYGLTEEMLGFSLEEFTLDELEAKFEEIKAKSEVDDDDDERREQEKRFETFWARYPRKTHMAGARDAWNQLKPDAALFEQILQAVERGRSSQKWNEQDGRFIPGPDRWLTEKRWYDEPTSQPTAQSTTEISKEAAEWLKDEL